MPENFKEEIRKIIMAAQTSDDVIKREVIRAVIYKEADLLSVGVAVVGVQNYDGLDIKWSFPTSIPGEYPVPEDAKAEIGDPMEAVDFNMTLDRAEVRYRITDWAKIRQLQNYQSEFSRRRASERLAILKDENILSVLYAGAGNTEAATKTWATATGTEIAGDIARSIGKIMTMSNIRETELSQIGIVIPAAVWGYTLAPVELENIRQSIQSYYKATHGVVFYPTRSTQIGNDGLVMVKGAKTAIHGVYTGGKVPLVEQKRLEGRGMEYIVGQFFKTKVVPESKTVSTSYRVTKLTGLKT